MRLLLDENLPKRLKLELTEFDVTTVFENGWAGKKNGELMHLLIQNGFNAFVTFDKNLQFQQNFKKYQVVVFVLVARDNRYETLRKLIPKLKEMTKKKLSVGSIIISE